MIVPFLRLGKAVPEEGDSKAVMGLVKKLDGMAGDQMENEGGGEGEESEKRGKGKEYVGKEGEEAG